METEMEMEIETVSMMAKTAKEKHLIPIPSHAI